MTPEKTTVPADAVTAVTKAVQQDKVDMLIGGYGSAATLADEVVAIQNKVPFIITGASNQLVTRRGPQGNYGGAGRNRNLQHNRHRRNELHVPLLYNNL